MNKSNQLRRMARDLGLNLSDFSRLLGVCDRSLDYYVKDDGKDPPEKVMNSARWVYFEIKGEIFKE